jgi:hypothetical protein
MTSVRPPAPPRAHAKNAGARRDLVDDLATLAHAQDAAADPVRDPDRALGVERDAVGCDAGREELAHVLGLHGVAELGPHAAAGQAPVVDVERVSRPASVSATTSVRVEPRRGRNGRGRGPELSQRDGDPARRAWSSTPPGARPSATSAST